VIVLSTERLHLRRFTLDDAAFVHELVNNPAWLRFIGDRGVRSLDDARRYLRDGPIASYAANGFGLWLVERKHDGAALGTCGLLRRATLPHVDLGFAFLERFRGAGYAVESARAVLAHALGELGLDRVVAITDPENSASIRVLESIGLRFQRLVRIADDDVELMLFGT
jgi:RimJ/RimL family protein N-acetyltransferase